RVHPEYLSVLGPDEFFACVDLATESGDVYDVDFFLEGSANNMTVTRTEIHKLNGKPFYTWQKTADNTWKTVPVAGASDDLLGVLRGKDLFTFHYDVEIPALSYPAQLWVPLASSDRFQQIDIMDIQGPGEHEIRTETENGNQYLYVELTPQEGSEHLTITYKVERLEKGTYREDDTNLERYLMEVPLLPVGGRFQSISEQVLAEKNADSPLTKARALYDYVIENVRYAKQGTYGTADANFACDAKSGNCTEFHSLFISLARSSGIPARFEVGAAIPSERNDGGMSGYHCWAEFYADGKWWPVDISEANKYTALATYYFGHHPANRIAFSKGRNLKVEPMPSTGAIPFFAYPILEEKGVPGPQTKTTFSFDRLM
ncbi:MAG: transglutaminase domain-containing protein, partial [Saprospiraceae bacterium]|nr:transglutaminase domain-containing protein [Saprospiraceae bacterium]